MKLASVARHAATALCAVAVLGGAALYFTGVRVHVVESPSMNPSIPTNAIVAVQPVRSQSVEVGDVISFTDPHNAGRTILHRVTELTDTTKGRVLRTKGDANPVADHFSVSDLELHGRAVAVVPRGGEAARLLTHDRAPYVLAGAPLVIWLTSLAVHALRNRRSLQKGFAQ